MDLATALDYAATPPNGVQRRVQRLASRAWAGSMLSKTLFPLDKMSFRLSRGRHTAASLLAGLPVILLTTVGARTGKARTKPLLGIPTDDNLAVIGSNFGTAATPGWVYNLEANPSAVVEYRGRTVPVAARRASAGETDRAFALAAAVYAAFPAYRERAAHRDIRVFILAASNRSTG
jgi:deazaflavin-dependent oxidoreductase (nitroreductase family)